MATFISTIKFTPQGIEKIGDTCKRADAFKKAAKSMGATVKQIYWTLGPTDGLLILDAPDEETATAAMLKLGSLGNVQTHTSRAYDAKEMQGILGKLGG